MKFSAPSSGWKIVVCIAYQAARRFSFHPSSRLESTAIACTTNQKYKIITFKVFLNLSMVFELTGMEHIAQDLSTHRTMPKDAERCH